MEETGHESKEALISETRTRVDRLLKVKHMMRSNEVDLVNSLAEKLERYGEKTFVSAKQLFWLRDMEERYVPDPRQNNLFEETET